MQHIKSTIIGDASVGLTEVLDPEFVERAICSLPTHIPANGTAGVPSWVTEQRKIVNLEARQG
jgi:hypothetical protein